MISTTCHCGAVTIRIPRAPETLICCNCSICRRYGTLWAYFDSGEVEIVGSTSACKTCGCVTHWEPVAPERGPRMGVNARNFEPSQLGDVRIRWLDGAVTEKYLEEGDVDAVPPRPPH